MPVALPLLALALLALLAWLTAAGLQATYSHSFGAAIRWLAGVLANVQIGAFGHGVKPFGFLARRLDAFDHFMQHSLGTLAAYNGNKVARFMLQVALLWTGVGYVVEKLAFGTLHALHDLRHSTIPKAVGGRAKPIQAKVNKVGKVNTAIGTQSIPALRRGLRTVEREERALARRVGALAAAVAGALALPGAGALDWPQPGTATKPTTNTGTRSRLKSLERLVLGAGVAALIWTGLRRLGLRWLRCYKVNKVGKAVCGMDMGLLDSFLTDALLIVGTLSLVEFAEEMRAVTGFLAGSIEHFWQADATANPETTNRPNSPLFAE